LVYFKLSSGLQMLLDTDLDTVVDTGVDTEVDTVGLAQYRCPMERIGELP